MNERGWCITELKVNVYEGELGCMKVFEGV